MIDFYLVCFYVIVMGLITQNFRHPGKICVLMIFGLFWVLHAFRAENIGSDTATYISLFEWVKIGGSLEHSRFEKGFVFLVNILTVFFEHSQWLLIITSSFILFGYAMLIYKYSSCFWLSSFLFLTAGLFRFSISGIRQNMAIVICSLAIPLLSKKKYILYCLFVFIASTIHSSASLLLLMPLIFEMDLKKMLHIVGFSAIIAFAMFSQAVTVFSFFFPEYLRFLDSIYNKGLSIAPIMNLLVSIFIFVYCYKVFSRRLTCSKIENFFLKCCFLKCALLFISLRLNAIDRIAEYFSIYEVILLPSAINFEKTSDEKNFLTTGTIASFLLYATIWYVGHPETQTVWPYSFFWSSKL